LLERPRNPKTERPVKVHFFNNHVQEVGTHIFYVPFDSHDELFSSSSIRPALDPLQLLDVVRSFLSTNDALLAKIMGETSAQGSSSIDANELPLRIADVQQGRFSRLLCSPRVGIGTTILTTEEDQVASQLESGELAETTERKPIPTLWPACGDNFLAVPLRVEPNWECSDAKCRSCDSKLLVEVFHKKPHSSIAHGHPCLIPVENMSPTALANSRSSLQEKLQILDADMAEWNIRYSGVPKNGLQRPCLCIERVVSSRTRSRAESPVRSVRGQKPLTIRSGG
jgi:hypothetical protein